MRTIGLAVTVSIAVMVGGVMAADYHVGPNQVYVHVSDVPWEMLGAGDRIYIHWRSDPYREKWVIGTSGTADSPILVSGVAGPGGELPIIDGRDATTRQALDYWNENRGLVKIGGTSVPGDTTPAYIVIENLELRSARPPYRFSDDQGSWVEYSRNAAAFYVEKGQHITIRNCIIHDSGNGIFVGVNGGLTRDILIESNWIYDNGIEGSFYEHNTYTAAIGITYQYNYMGALRDGAGGNNLKDRSAGLVVRYNWIENGNRQLDLVDGEDSPVVVGNPAYRATYVYGNLLMEGDGEGNSQIVHYGGDSGTVADYRKGTLYFYNNTVISTRTGNTTLLRLSTDEESAQVFNNILFPSAEGDRLALLADAGMLTLSNNWLKSGWRQSHEGSFSGVLTDGGGNIEGTDPGFSNFGGGDYRLAQDAAGVDGGRALPGALAMEHPLLQQYLLHRQHEARPRNGQLDMGAWETVSALLGDVDGSGEVDLADVIISLQVLSGSGKSVSFISETDIGDDNQVGMAEVLWGLHEVAGRNAE